MPTQTHQESEHSAPAMVQYEHSPPLETVIAPFPKGHVLTQAEMVSLQKRLVAKNKMVSGPAEQQLAQMDASALTAFLAFERQNRSRKIKCTVIGLVIGYGILVTVSVLAHQSGMFSMFGAFTGVIAGAAAFSKSYKSGVIALTRLENTDSVGELISALEIQDKEVQQVVRPALIKMLPNMRASDAKLLNDENRQTLRKFLLGKLNNRARYVDTTPPASPAGSWSVVRPLRAASTDVDAQLRVEILNALCQIGDGSFIEVVETLAIRPGHRASGMAQEIAAAAQECLPYLRQRKLAAEASSELVRPSQANSVGGASTLLRPVVGTQDIHETELLRAAEE